MPVSCPLCISGLTVVVWTVVLVCMCVCCIFNGHSLVLQINTDKEHQLKAPLILFLIIVFISCFLIFNTLIASRFLSSCLFSLLLLFFFNLSSISAFIAQPLSQLEEDSAVILSVDAIQTDSKSYRSPWLLKGKPQLPALLRQINKGHSLCPARYNQQLVGAVVHLSI